MSEDKKITRRELLTMTSPLGRVSLERNRCTGCGLCVAGCPTEALSIRADGLANRFELLFRHGACIACSSCVENCPEDCLVLERVMELDRLDEPAEVLFDDEIALCTGCGKPVGPKAMLQSIKSKLGDSAELQSQIGLCPECKSRNFLRAL